MKLNGWQRIGVVLSIVWIIGAGIYQRHADIQRASDSAGFAFRICSDNEQLKPEIDLDRCTKEIENSYKIWMVGSWGNVAFFAFVPMLLGWVAAYVLIRVWRWVKTGFKTKGMEVER